jgi:malate synthase
VRESHDGFDGTWVAHPDFVPVNVSVGARYLDAWLRGVGAVAIDNLMEDAATAEISRSQVMHPFVDFLTLLAYARLA